MKSEPPCVLDPGHRIICLLMGLGLHYWRSEGDRILFVDRRTRMVDLCYQREWR